MVDVSTKIAEIARLSVRKIYTYLLGFRHLWFKICPKCCIITRLKRGHIPFGTLTVWTRGFVMKNLILLYWGCVCLLYLSQVFYLVATQLQRSQNSRHHFMRKKSDIFVAIAIFGSLASLFYGRVTMTAYCQVKDKKFCMERHLVKGAIFCPYLQGCFFLNKSIL